MACDHPTAFQGSEATGSASCSSQRELFGDFLSGADLAYSPLCHTGHHRVPFLSHLPDLYTSKHHQVSVSVLAVWHEYLWPESQQQEVHFARANLLLGPQKPKPSFDICCWRPPYLEDSTGSTYRTAKPIFILLCLPSLPTSPTPPLINIQFRSSVPSPASSPLC